MCKSIGEGGQRCASHAKKALQAAEGKLMTATSSPVARSQALIEWETASAEYASTPTGQKHYETLIADAEESGATADVFFYTATLKRGASIREANAIAAAMIHSGRSTGLAPVNPSLLSPPGLAKQVSDWYPHEADPEVVADLLAADFRIVSLDIETTHLSPQVGQITEISWYNLNTGEGGTFIPAHTLDGADPVSLEISKYDERLAGKQHDDGSQFVALQELLGGDGTKTYLMGSNPKFDAGHLEAMAARLGMEQPQFNHRTIDSAQAAYWLNPKAEFGKPTGLKEATTLAGLDLDNHHEAWEDTVAAARLWHVWEKTRRSLPGS